MIDMRDVEVRKFGHSKRSKLNRSVDRSLRSHQAARRPRRDDEIMKAWLLRLVRRTPDVFAVDDPEYRYCPDPTGPEATQVAFVRAIEARDDYERELFRGLRIPTAQIVRYAVPPYEYDRLTATAQEAEE